MSITRGRAMKSLKFGIIFIMIFAIAGNVMAELTKNDMEEIRAVVKEELGHVEKNLNWKMEQMEKNLDQRMNDMFNLLLVILAGMFALVGFVLWDRRTALVPAIRKNKELADKEEKIERALKEYAMREPKMAEALKSVGML